MTGLQPYCRVTDLFTNHTLASTTNIIDYGWDSGLDRIGNFSITISGGDPGDADYNHATPTNQRLGFADAVLQATSDVGGKPKPLLFEMSLDGGAFFDTRKMADHPVRSFKVAQRTIREDGADIASLLSTVPQERITFTEVALADCFNAAAGTISPLVGSGFLTLPDSHGHRYIPYLAGILTVAPGLASWPDAARTRLKFTASIYPGPGTDLRVQATTVDIDSATTLAALQTIVNRLAGATPNQDYGHYVLDCADAALNLSGTTVWSNPDGSDAITNALVIGNKGSRPSPFITFDATANTDVDETTTARVNLENTSIATDDSTIYEACNFVGGKSTAGWPTNGTVSGLAVINTQVAHHVGMSGTRDSWSDCLPLVGIDAGDSGGGLFFYAGDGTMRAVPNSPNARCLSLAYDPGNESIGRKSALFMSTPKGIYWTGSANIDLDVLGTTLAWSLLGTGLTVGVKRLQVNEIPSTHIDAGGLAVWALVTGQGENLDGVYRCTTLSPAWQRLHVSPHVLDLCTTDFGTFWTIQQAKQTSIYRNLYNESTRGVTSTEYALDHGQAAFLQRVPTAAYTGAHGQPSVPDQDTVWALTVGAPSPAYYLVNDLSGAWGDHTFYDANFDGTLSGAAVGFTTAEHLQAYRAIAVGFEIEQQYVSVMVGTNAGIYWSKQPLGSALDWHSANDLGGLGGYEVRNLGLGDYQYLLGDTTRRINRMFLTTQNDLLVSGSAGRWWQAVQGRDRTTMGPHLSQITLRLLGMLPSNRIRTWGSRNSDGTAMTASPFTTMSDDWNSTHVYVPVGDPDELPKGYYVERYLDGHLDFQYRLVRQDAVWPGLQMSQLPELQSNTTVVPDAASKAVITVAKRWLSQHADAQTLVTLESTFSTSESALRRLKPTHKASLVGTVSVRDVSPAGSITNSHLLSFDGSEDLWVIAHSIKKGPGQTATTTTTLATQLRQTPVSESDLAQALSDSIHSIKLSR